MSAVDDERMRRCCLVRAEDVSGMSGIGVVVEGVLSATDNIVLSWYGEYHKSITPYDTLEDLAAVHGYEERSRVAWLDPVDGRGHRD